MSSVADLLSILDLEQLEINLFRGISPQVGMAPRLRRPGDRAGAGRGHAHGGGRAAAFAARLFPARPAIRTCRSSTRSTASATARVSPPAASSPSSTASRSSRWWCSFHNDEAGLSHQMPMPDVPQPDQLPSDTEVRSASCPDCPSGARLLERERPIELRPVDFAVTSAHPAGQSLQYLDPHRREAAGRSIDPRCALAYASDMTLLDTTLVAAGERVRYRCQGRDRPRALVSPAVQGRRMAALCPGEPQLPWIRGFARGLILRQDGTLVASVAQEGLVRERRSEPKPG